MGTWMRNPGAPGVYVDVAAGDVAHYMQLGWHVVGGDPPDGGSGGTAVPVNAEDNVLTGLTAGHGMSGHRMVRLSTAGVVVYASSDDPAGMARPAWMTTGAAASGAAVTLAYYGLVTEPSWAWSPGPLYVGVGGLLTQTPPASGYIRLVGAAVSATTVWLDPQPAIALA